MQTKVGSNSISKSERESVDLTGISEDNERDRQ